jgi:Cytochrome c554 and c-prime
MMTAKRVRLRIAALAGCLFVAAQATGQYVDTSAGCILCHQATPLGSDFCSVTPAAVWARDDKHKRAFYLLHDSNSADPQKGAAKRELVRRILGFELGEAFANGHYLRLKADGDAETVRKVATVKACLRCHSTWPKEADEIFPVTPPVPLELGVSCQACHGPGEKWDLPHRLTAWRAVTPAAKESLGFADCRSPAAKARLCASCHVGNLAEEKFVKHEWYAAGHPPLPSFELASFEAQMPAHWKSLREKGAFAFRDGPPNDDSGMIAGQMTTLERMGIPSEGIKASYREANFPGAAAKGLDPSSDLPSAKDAVVGAAAVFENYVRLVRDYAALAEGGKSAWPELAIYDCSACHHELRSGLGIQSRHRRSHPPGRPPLADWPAALAPLVAYQAADNNPAQAQQRWSNLEGKLLKLDLATTQRPFGNAAAMRAPADDALTALAELTTDAGNTRFDSAAASHAIAFLADPRHEEVNDFSSARQLAWAARAILGDLDVREAERLFMQGSNDPLALSLPSGPERSVMENLRRWLPAAAKYDPAWFRSELQAARTLSPRDGR